MKIDMSTKAVKGSVPGEQMAVTFPAKVDKRSCVYIPQNVREFLGIKRDMYLRVTVEIMGDGGAEAKKTDKPTETMVLVDETKEASSETS